jgi:hypothetical protein
VCAARDYPVRGLAGHGGNVVEVGIVVQYGCAVVLGRGGGEQVHHAGGAVLACGGEKRLDLAGPAGDLVGAGELDQLTAYSEDPLVSPGLAGRVAQFQSRPSPARRRRPAAAAETRPPGSDTRSCRPRCRPGTASSPPGAAHHFVISNGQCS